MSAPNPYLPDATGRAPANDYTWTSQNGAKQAAAAIAVQVAKHYGPAILKALRGLR
jgi:hypothetical protein